MIKYIPYTNRLDWNSIVDSFYTRDVYYFNEYVQPIAINKEGEPTLIYYSDGETRSYIIVVIREIPNQMNNMSTVFFDITTPYGYGGFVVEGILNSISISKMIKEYTQSLVDHHIVTEFIRFNPFTTNPLLFLEYYNITNVGHTITIGLHDLNTLWNGFTSKNRNVIRKAQKNGVIVLSSWDEEVYWIFVKMYIDTMHKDNADKYYFFSNEYFSQMYREFKNFGRIFYAMYNSHIIAAAMILYANDTIHYHLSGSERAYLHLAPNNLLIHSVASWGIENGFSRFHLGGGLGGSNDSLFKFKEAFCPKGLTDFYIGRRIIDTKNYIHIIQNSGETAKNEVDDSDFHGYFPRYRRKKENKGV